MKVGDLLRSTRLYRREYGLGIVIRVIKEKFKPTKVEVCFPASQNFRPERFIVPAKYLRVVSESREFSKD